MGVTRSIGTERTEWFFGYLYGSSDLANAYFSYIDRLYDPDWIHSQWPSDTTECFMFDFALFGNPFWSPRPSGAPLTWQQETNINQSTGETQYEGGNPNGNGLFDGDYINTNYPPYGGYLRELAPGTGYGRYYQVDLTGFSGADSVRPYWLVRGSHAGGAYQYVDVNGRATWDDPDPQDTTTWWVWGWTLDPGVFNWNSSNNYIKVGNQGRAWGTLCLRAIGCNIYGAGPLTDVEEPKAVPSSVLEPNVRLFVPGVVSGPVKICYGLPDPEPMHLSVIDASGRVTRVLAKGNYSAGVHTAMWDRTDQAGHRVAAGVYVCRLVTGSRVATARVTLAR
jgi:hypothetical protein